MRPLFISRSTFSKFMIETPGRSPRRLRPLASSCCARTCWRASISRSGSPLGRYLGMKSQSRRSCLVLEGKQRLRELVARQVAEQRVGGRTHAVGREAYIETSVHRRRLQFCHGCAPSFATPTAFYASCADLRLPRRRWRAFNTLTEQYKSSLGDVGVLPTDLPVQGRSFQRHQKSGVNPGPFISTRFNRPRAVQQDARSCVARRDETAICRSGRGCSSRASGTTRPAPSPCSSGWRTRSRSKSTSCWG